MLPAEDVVATAMDVLIAKLRNLQVSPHSLVNWRGASVLSLLIQELQCDT